MFHMNPTRFGEYYSVIDRFSISCYELTDNRTPGLQNPLFTEGKIFWNTPFSIYYNIGVVFIFKTITFYILNIYFDQELFFYMLNTLYTWLSIWFWSSFCWLTRGAGLHSWNDFTQDKKLKFLSFQNCNSWNKCNILSLCCDAV